MNKFLWFLPVVVLSACSGKGKNPAEIIGFANPASVFCEQQGGRSVLRKDEAGNAEGFCVFPGGKEVEEWTYFHLNFKTEKQPF